MGLQGHVLDVGNLTPSQRNAMFVLMEQHYDNARREVFDADLAEKHWVILLTDADGHVKGFSTQMLFDVFCRGEPVTALFSGDTIVDRAWWSQNPLSRVWGRFARSLMDRYPAGSFYWFLISKGYRTYRFLPLFFHEFYPHFARPTPAREAALLSAFARHKFPDRFDETTGIVHTAADQSHLQPGLAEITSQRRRDPHVAFFEQRNPGHARGDELCCLARLTPDNFTAAADRALGI